MPDDDLNPEEEEEEIKEADIGKGGGTLFRTLLTFGTTSIIAIGCAFVFVWAVLSSPVELSTEENKEPKDEPAAFERNVPTVKLEDIIVNVQGTNGRRYLKATIYLEVDKNFKDQVEESKVLMMDALISLLSTKQLDDLEGMENQNKIRREIRDELNSVLGKKDVVKRVYLYDFVVQ